MQKGRQAEREAGRQATDSRRTLSRWEYRQAIDVSIDRRYIHILTDN